MHMVESHRSPWSQGSRVGAKDRDKALSMAKKRKEEYLGARVPRWLKDKVMERAREVGVPVSILILYVLEEAFRDEDLGLCAQSGADVDTKVDAARAETAVNRFPAVIGWEEIRLNRTMACSGCGKRLNAGAYVTLGFATPGEEHVILCGLCKESL